MTSWPGESPTAPAERLRELVDAVNSDSAIHRLLEPLERALGPFELLSVDLDGVLGEAVAAVTRFRFGAGAVTTTQESHFVGAGWTLEDLLSAVQVFLWEQLYAHSMLLAERRDTLPTMRYAWRPEAGVFSAG